MKKEELAFTLRRQAVQVSPALRQRTLRAARGKEATYMRRKITAAAAFALVAVTLAVVALATANHWGILDFVSRYQGAYIPEDAASYVQTDVLQMQDERFRVNVREQYYDGRTARLAIDVTPLDSSILLTGVDTALTDNWQNLWQPESGWSEGDKRSVLDVLTERGYTQAYCVNVWTQDAQNGGMCGAMDYRLSEDGTLTIFMQEEYDDDRPTREMVIMADFSPYAFPVSADSAPDYEHRIRLEQPLVLTAAVDATIAPAAEGAVAGAYVSAEPVDYPQCGVRVERVLIEVKPQEIYATVDFTVTDQQAFDAMEDGLWFEFIDPQSTEAEPYAQRLKSGLSGGGGVYSQDDVHYRQTETLGKNELHSSYTLRAFSCWDKTRFETQTFAMRPATAQDLTDIRAAE